MCKSFVMLMHHGKIKPDTASLIDFTDSLGEINLFKEIDPDAKEAIIATMNLVLLVMWIRFGWEANPIDNQL